MQFCCTWDAPRLKRVILHITEYVKIFNSKYLRQIIIIHRDSTIDVIFAKAGTTHGANLLANLPVRDWEFYWENYISVTLIKLDYNTYTHTNARARAWDTALDDYIGTSWMNNSSRGCVIKRLSWKAGHAWRYNWLVTSGKSSLRLLIFAIRSLASVQLAGVTHEMFLLSRMIIESANWFRSPIKEDTY